MAANPPRSAFEGDQKTPGGCDPPAHVPPEHHAYRQILHPFFAAQATNKLEGPLREFCDSLIAGFEHRGSCEFISEFALRFPSFVFLERVGLPRQMLPEFLDWERDIFRGQPAQRVSAARAVLHYLEGFVAEQRRNPTCDLLEGLFSAKLEGRPLTHEEVMGMLYLLYVGGLDTVASACVWRSASSGS